MESSDNQTSKGGDQGQEQKANGERISKSANSSPIASPRTTEQKLEEQADKYKQSNRELMELLAGSEEMWAKSINQSSSENAQLQEEFLLLWQKLQEYEGDLGPLGGMAELLSSVNRETEAEGGEEITQDQKRKQQEEDHQKDEDEDEAGRLEAGGEEDEEQEEDDEDVISRMMELEAKISSIHTMQETVSRENAELEAELAQLLSEEAEIGDKIAEYQEAIVNEEGRISNLMHNLNQAKADIDTYNEFLTKEKQAQTEENSTDPEPQIIKAQNTTNVNVANEEVDTTAPTTTTEDNDTDSRKEEPSE